MFLESKSNLFRHPCVGLAIDLVKLVPVKGQAQLNRASCRLAGKLRNRTNAPGR